MRRLLLALLLLFLALPTPARASSAQADIVRLGRAYGIDPYWALAVATVETQDGLLVTYNPDGSVDVGRLQVNSAAVRALGTSSTTRGPVDWTTITSRDLVDDPALAIEAGVIMLRWWLHEALDEMGVYHTLDPELRAVRYTGQVWAMFDYGTQDEALRLASAWYNGGPGANSRTWYTLQVLSETRAWRDGRRTTLPPLQPPPPLSTAQQPVMVFLPLAMLGYDGEPVVVVLAVGCAYTKDPGVMEGIAARRNLSLAGTRGAVELADEAHLGKLVYLRRPDGLVEGPFRVVNYWPGGWAPPPADYAVTVSWSTWVRWDELRGSLGGCLEGVTVLWYPQLLPGELRAVGRSGTIP